MDNDRLITVNNSSKSCVNCKNTPAPFEATLDENIHKLGTIIQQSFVNSLHVTEI